MSYAMRDLYIFHVHYSCCLDSQKIYDRENTLLTRTEGEKKKFVTQAPAYEHILKPLFQRFLRCTASWLEWCGFSHF